MNAGEPAAAPLPRVLLVDDEPLLLEGLAVQLRGWFEVSTAPSAEAALELVASGRQFDVVVADLCMPGMDGIGLLTRLRTLAPGAVRILLSGHATLGAGLAAVHAGHVYRILTKPCPASLCLRALTDAIAHQRGDAGRREAPRSGQ